MRIHIQPHNWVLGLGLARWQGVTTLWAQVGPIHMTDSWPKAPAFTTRRTDEAIELRGLEPEQRRLDRW